MNAALIASDEEVDTGPYTRYLRARTDAELWDIARHTDPEAYPARCDMVAREIRRRGSVASARYTPGQFAVRCLSVAGIGLCVVPLLLASLLDPATARTGDWPDAAALSEGVSAQRVLTLLLIGSLRVTLNVCVRTGVFPLLIVILTAYLTVNIRAMRDSSPARDVERLAFAALVVLLVTVWVTGHSAVPLVFGTEQNGVGWLNPLGRG